MPINLKELASGLVFVVIGGFFAGNAALYLRMGTSLNMGPGYFPFILGLVLIGLGIAIAVSGMKTPAEPAPPIPWRGMVLVISAIVFFGVTVRGLGFGPSLFTATALAAASSGRMSWTGIAVLSLVLTVFSVAVFVHALGLPYPVFGRWLGF